MPTRSGVGVLPYLEALARIAQGVQDPVEVAELALYGDWPIAKDGTP